MTASVASSPRNDHASVARLSAGRGSLGQSTIAEGLRHGEGALRSKNERSPTSRGGSAGCSFASGSEGTGPYSPVIPILAS